MKNKILYILFFLVTLSSCGDSPFLNDEPRDKVMTDIQGLASGELRLGDEEILIRPFWREGPLVANESRLLIVVTDLEGTPFSPDMKFNLMLWMPGMGHGSFPVSTVEVSEGIFEATEIFFTMPGYWDIHFQILDDTAIVVDEVKWPLEL